MLVFSRSESHHAFWLSSLSSSAEISVIIFLISVKTISKGLPACSMAKTLAMTGLCLAPSARCKKATALALGEASSAWALTEARAPCLWTEARCTNDTAPVLVAATLPKIAKAASLLRMAMASARAVSSDARSSTRVSYCFFFAAHMSKSLAKKSSASALVLSADSSCVLFAARSPSLSESRPCLVLYSDAIASWASSMSFVYLL
mmetsp:Transcript_102538/g.294195  ORF Transcript_102538/g.294195 Transcript_102538/m.294195 type:complete len:205 (-) Transcript_102538:830-1444(-)